MENVGLGAGLAALAFWGFVAAVVVGGIWDGIRKREAQHETIRRVIESGQPIDSELMDKLVTLTEGKTTRSDRDFKITALWLLPISPGLALFGLILGTMVPPVLPPLLGAAALVGCMGVGFLVAAKVTARWYTDDVDATSDRTRA